MTIASIEEGVYSDPDSDEDFYLELERRYRRELWSSVWRTFRWPVWALVGYVIWRLA